MAKAVLINLESAAAEQICHALAIDGYEVEHHQLSVVTRDLWDADIVFAGGEPAQYMPLLRQVREVHPTSPFVVVAKTLETSAWLDALEAGATDYYAIPIETRQIRWLMESALPQHADHGDSRRSRDPVLPAPSPLPHGGNR
jgi:DNA-binding response OmpR family regulator